jgi:hypothetical protein
VKKLRGKRRDDERRTSRVMVRGGERQKVHRCGGDTHGKRLCRLVFFALVTLCLKLAFDLPSSLTLSRRS